MTKLQIDADMVQQALDAAREFINDVHFGEWEGPGYRRNNVQDLITDALAALQQPEQQSLRHEPFNHRNPMQPEPQDVTRASELLEIFKDVDQQGTLLGMGKQQAQAGEPEVVAWLRRDGMKAMPTDVKEAYVQEEDAFSKEIVEDYSTPLITLQSHREAMAKFREALKACVMALEIAANFCGKHTAEECPDLIALPIKDATTKAQGAMKP